MSKFKALFLSLTAFTFLLAPLSVFAQSSQPSQSTIVIEVVDQDGRDIAGTWFLHEGTGDQGLIFRNGTWGETFTVPAYATYYLRGQMKNGYSSFEVVGDNPQTTLLREATVFRLVYTAEGEVAGESAEGAETPSDTAEESMNEETGAQAEDESTTVEPGSPLEERLSHTGRPVGVNRDLVQDSSSAVAEVSELPRPLELAVTGPAGMLGLLMLGSSLGGLWITRRRRA